MVDQVHGVKLEDLEPVIQRPMTNADILAFRNALIQSYNPENRPDGVQKSDIKVEADEKFLYFLMKTDRKDKNGNTVWRIIFKMRKYVDTAKTAKKPFAPPPKNARPTDPRAPPG
jgi:hypothetical protein